MLDLIRGWLVGITCAAMIAALAEGLMPQGAVRKVGRLAGGLLLLVAIVQPILKIDTNALSSAMTQYRLEVSAYSSQLEEENDTLMKALIEEQAAAYILDKAMALGTDCDVQVEADGEGYPIPQSVTITGSLTLEQMATLTREIEASFAIPADRQRYESGEIP